MGAFRSLVLVGSAVGGAALASPLAASADNPCGSSGVLSQVGSVQTCTYTAAGTDTFTVPSGVSSLDVVAIGAAGGAGDAGGPGGLGASVEDTAVPISPNDVLGVTVGGVGSHGQGNTGGAGGTPGGGGAGGDYPAIFTGDEDGGGGGGYSGLFDPSNNPLVIAGGGGGSGGAGGAGGDGDTGSGGVQGAGGDDGSTGGGGATSGGPGVAGAGGNGGGTGSPGSSTAAPDGAGGQGGTSSCCDNSSGGGGGGGYFGGGGGGGSLLAAGGGGGASFGVSGLTNEMTSSAAAEVVVNFSTSGSSGTSLHASAPATGTPGTTIMRSAIRADLSGGSAPTGAIVFRVFGPQATPPSLCSSGGATVGTPVGVSGDGIYHPNADFTPSAAGDYWWYASYSGDGSNTPAASPCGGAMPETTVGGGSATPSNTSPPTISGTARQGKTLTESHGTWTATPTGYGYQWFDCSSSGGAPCSLISGATGQSYKLTASDVGHTIRVVETAQFASGSGKAVSAATAVVTAATPSAPQITKFKIRSKHHSAKFAFSSSGATGYECALVKHHKHKHKKPHFSSCSSPKLYQNLKAGNYTFQVKGISPGGTGPVVKQTFTI
jgi:hypothetical protein